jgi:AcrR family transcriptional regulator
VAAARRDFFANGYRSVTMDDLAAELGMSKKTLYAHFSSKAALLEAIFDDKFQQIETDLTRITEECASDFAAGLEQLLACFHRHTAEIQPAFVRDIQREAPDLFQKVAQRRRDLIQRHFGKVLSEGRREGLVRKDIPVHLIVEILLAATQAIMNPPRMAELGLSPASGFAAITSVILQGVITDEGRARR